jgi:hypothetical protein
MRCWPRNGRSIPFSGKFPQSPTKWDLIGDALKS